MENLVIQPGESADSPLSIFIMGPTATGKTDLAIALYHAFPTQIVSVDSALVYKGMDIGSAKPDNRTLADAPHHLIDFIDPRDHYSAGQFRDHAMGLMQQITTQGDIPLLVGGTMLYFNALQKGMADLPVIDKNVRLQLDQEQRENGLEAMYERLQTVDPQSAGRLHKNDTQRIKRALEVYDSSGKTLSYFWQKQAAFRFPYQRLKIALMPADRVGLRLRITQRFDLMLKQGFIEEVETLRRRGDLHIGLPSIRAVGYRQVWAYLDGEYSFDIMREKAIIATVQLAKRQMTWLRKEPECNFIDPSQLNTDKVLQKLVALLL